MKTEMQYNLRMNETLRAVKTAMAVAPREFWRCEPSVHEEGTTTCVVESRSLRIEANNCLVSQVQRT